jgi:prepilin-type N-terminal cleavage/methylation domain-containing protein
MNNKKLKGFTLIELLVVVLIIGIFAAITILYML